MRPLLSRPRHTLLRVQPWPVPTLVRTSASHSSSFAASEAARRRLDAVVVELTDRGFHLLAAIVSSWVPPEGLPAFDEPCEPTAGSSEDRAVRPVPLESNGALPLASLGDPELAPTPTLLSGRLWCGRPGDPELYGPDAAGLVLAPLWEYVARGLLRTRLGQRLVHPAAVVQYVAAAAAALVGAGSTRAAVAAAPAPSVSSLRQWMPSWVAGGGGVQPQGSPTLKGGPEGVRPGAREQQQQAYRPSSSAAAAAVPVAGPDAAAGTVVASASPQAAAVTGITVGCSGSPPPRLVTASAFLPPFSLMCSIYAQGMSESARGGSGPGSVDELAKCKTILRHLVLCTLDALAAKRA